jgi:hypothetical protein
MSMLRQTRRRAFITLILSAAVFTLSAPALAADNKPPRATLHAAGKAQKGDLYSFGWSRPTSPTECTGANLDGVLSFRGRGLSIGAGRRVLKISFAKPEKPSSLEFSRWTRIDQDGMPVGQARGAKYRLLKRGTGPSRRWIARFKNVPVTGNVYIDVFARWPSPECGQGGDASWSFHVAP